jgi:AraC-like DNA-binding protein
MDSARFQPLAGLSDVEILSARYRRHRFAPHVHDTWAIGAVLSGVQDNSAAANGGNIVHAGELTALRPNEPHAGRALGENGCGYALIYVTDERVRERAAVLGLGAPDLPRLAIKDRDLVAQLARLVGDGLNILPGEQAPVMDMEVRLSAFLDALIRRHASTAMPKRDIVPVFPGARFRRARDFLHDHRDRAVSLGELADEAALSPYHFCRQFGEVYGLTPHRYHLMLRLNQAKFLIAEGVDLAQAAQMTGFADQSHLGRHFKRCFGFSPGIFAAALNPPIRRALIR